MVTKDYAADDARQLLTVLSSAGAHPRLTWYHPRSEGGQRLELSGHVLAMHSAKAAGFLLSEIGATPGQTLAYSAPSSWRMLPWILGAWAAGLSVTPLTDQVASTASGESRTPTAPTAPATPTAAGLDVVALLSEDPHAWASFTEEHGWELIALARPDLATRFPGPPLPPDCLDAVADSMSQPDHFTPLSPAQVAPLPLPQALAQLGGGAEAAQGAEPAAHVASPGLIAREQQLSATVIASVMATWAAGQRAIVIPASLSAAQRAQLAENEGIVAT